MMNFWHIQMYKPYGSEDDTRVSSLEMLRRDVPVIGTGEWEDLQCENFKQGMVVGDIVFVREGNESIALCEVVSDCFQDAELQKLFCHTNYRKVKVLDWNNGLHRPRPRLFSQGTLNPCSNLQTEQSRFIISWYQAREKEIKMKKYVDILRTKKNLILQGAPGTGKTYTTASIAVALCAQDFPDFADHKKVMEEYERLRAEGRIAFCTFHQSMDYEDFVEGLKPEVVEDNKGVVYKPEDGLFKLMCDRARTPENTDITKCIDAYLQKIKGFENKREIPTISGRSRLFVWWKEGNDTISTRSVYSQASGTDDSSPSPLNIEKVKQQALGDGEENNWRQYAQAFINAVKKDCHWAENCSDRPHVLIIDEINRGNVSKIFGELITLLEADKRSGKNSKHPITVKLPYSKEDFSVPDNLYIIGTMNTTDRSTGTIDYAVRRRFAFETLQADGELIQGELAKELFGDVKKFVADHKCGEDFDIDDLMVGHSYFMARNEDELKLKMQYEVIPLLKEYIKDGILSVQKEDSEKHFSAWRDLKTCE